MIGMQPDFITGLPVVWIAGAVVLVCGAILALIAWLSRRDSGPTEPAEATVPELVVLSVQAQDRLEESARILGTLLGDDSEAAQAVLRERLLLSTESPLQGQYMHAPGEVADALVMVARVLPSVAQYDESVRLLSKLRALVGSRDFLFVCGQLAVALREPRHGEIAERLGGGTLAWDELVLFLRGLPMAQTALAVDHKFSPHVARKATS
jgi:hypothetical protein